MCVLIYVLRLSFSEKPLLHWLHRYDFSILYIFRWTWGFIYVRSHSGADCKCIISLQSVLGHISGKRLCENAFSNFAQWLQWYDFSFIGIFCCLMLQVPTIEFIFLAYRHQYYLSKWISTIHSINRKLILPSSCTKYQCKIMTFYDTKSLAQKNIAVIKFLHIQCSLR